MGKAQSTQKAQPAQQQQADLQQTVDDYGSNAQQAANLQAMGDDSGDPGSALRKLASAELEQAVDAVWEALGSEEIDVKEAAIEVLLHAVTDAQAAGADDLIANQPWHDQVSTLVFQISQMGDRRKQVEMVQLCQMLGLQPPTRASAVVKEEVEKAGTGVGPRRLPQLPAPQSDEEKEQIIDQILKTAPPPAREILTPDMPLRDKLAKIPLIGPLVSGPATDLIAKLDDGKGNVPMDSPAVPTEVIEQQRQEQADAAASGAYSKDQIVQGPPIPF